MLSDIVSDGQFSVTTAESGYASSQRCKVFGWGSKTAMVDRENALKGRDTPMQVSTTHVIFGSSTVGPWPGMEQLVVGMGCFWGAERKFWQAPGVVSTSAGYAAGFTPNPTYEEVCSGKTGHNEVVRVVFDPMQTGLAQMLQVFWENHDPTQGMRQGNDVGTQYRSGLYLSDPAHREVALKSKAAFGARLRAAGLGVITTEVIDLDAFYMAEEFHQQYLHKNPGGYCGMGGTGVSCPLGALGDAD